MYRIGTTQTESEVNNLSNLDTISILSHVRYVDKSAIEYDIRGVG